MIDPDVVERAGVVFLDDPRESVDHPQRRPQVVRHGVAERLEFAGRVLELARALQRVAQAMLGLVLALAQPGGQILGDALRGEFGTDLPHDATVADELAILRIAGKADLAKKHATPADRRR